VAQYLQTIRNTINRVDGEVKVDDGLLRAVHTLHGAIAMVDIPLLTQLLSPLESLLKRLRAAGQPLSIEGVSLLARSADAVDYVMGQFDNPNPQLPDLEALIARIVDLRDSQPEPQVAHVLFEPQEDEIEQDETEAHDAAPPAEAPAAPSPEDEHHNAYAAELLAALDAFELDAANEAELDAPAPIVKTGHGDEEDDFAALFGDLIEEDAGEPSADAASHEHAPTEIESFAVAPVEIEPVLTDIPLEAESADNVTHTFVPEVIQDVSELPLIEEESALTDSSELVSLHEALQHTEEALPVALHEDEPVVEAIPAIDAEAEAQLLREIEAAEANLAAAEASVEPPVVEALAEPVVEEVHAVKAPVEEVVEEAPAANESNAAMVYGQIDPDLLEIFIEEGREILDHADGVLAQWRAEPTELEHVASLQRDLHTLKGGARIAGMLAVGDLTHAIETLLERPVGQHTLQAGELISALEGGFDQLHLLVQRVSQGRPIEYPQAMIDRFLELSGETSVEEAVPPPAIAPLRVDLPELLPEEGQEEENRGPQEQIRVRAELLDSLVNHAGEVAIYRSRLEQQVAGYRFNLVELDQTVQRLRSQLRMLEIETEAQIIARFQREHREAGLSVFDPLELDRYSQLQQYSRALAESVSDLVSIQNMLDELTRQAETLLIQQSRVSSELQDGLLRTRMLPFDTMVPNLRRTLRQAAQDQGKGAQLYVEGAHGEMDRNLLDRIKAPFEHMLRNAVAHGIETPVERRKAGKPEEGAVRIRVAREATEVVVRVTDDGRGLDREAIRKRGVERGLLRAESNPSDDQILQLITQTGFSTASEVTQLAGRGVGMDVVANEIKQLGGSLAIDSQQGKGTTFVLRLPFTLAVTQAILVRIGESNFAIPMTSVQGVARITPAELAVRMAEPNPTFEYGGEQYGIHDLSELLGLVPNHALDEVQLPLLLTRAGDLRAAIRIDAVIGSREIVVKSVGPQVSSVPGILGATIMGDGSVLVILDLAPLVRHGIVRREQRLSEGLSAIQTPVVEEIRTKPLIMVVDDSITMRKVTGRVLERHEYEVSTAKDGLDAVEKLHDRVPDLMLLDIEMPRMDGYELATHMKADPRLRNVPIIMITSRTGDKHRQRAFDIGVDRYLGKPYQEAELLMQINEVLEQRAMAAVESIDE
jgi:chemosensory pili system protein ChpA (sensor histidine kinase/response regulator)